MTPNSESSEAPTIPLINPKIISIYKFIRSYGKGQNKADTFPKTGRKQQLVEKMVSFKLNSVFTTNYSINKRKIKTTPIISPQRYFHNNQSRHIRPQTTHIKRSRQAGHV